MSAFTEPYTAVLEKPNKRGEGKQPWKILSRSGSLSPAGTLNPNHPFPMTWSVRWGAGGSRQVPGSLVKTWIESIKLRLLCGLVVHYVYILSLPKNYLPHTGKPSSPSLCVINHL